MQITTDKYCRQCGSCCRAIVIYGSFNKIKQNTSKDTVLSDQDFIKNNWIPINEGTAFKINPRLHDLVKTSKEPRFFYICKKFDAVNNRCTIHGLKIKPEVCSQFPVYQYDAEQLKASIDLFKYSENCGYYTGEVWKELQGANDANNNR